MGVEKEIPGTYELNLDILIELIGKEVTIDENVCDKIIYSKTQSDKGRFFDESSKHRLEKENIKEILEMLKTDKEENILLITSRKTKKRERITIVLNYFFRGFPVEIIIDKGSNAIVTIFERENLSLPVIGDNLLNSYEIIKTDENISTLYRNKKFNTTLKKKQRWIKYKMKKQLETINEMKKILNIKGTKQYYSPEGIYEDIKAHLLESIGVSYMKRNIERTSSFQRNYEKFNYRDKNDYERMASIGAYVICKFMNIADNYLAAILHYDLNKTNKDNIPLTIDRLNEYNNEFNKDERAKKMIRQAQKYTLKIDEIEKEREKEEELVQERTRSKGRSR